MVTGDELLYLARRYAAAVYVPTTGLLTFGGSTHGGRQNSVQIVTQNQDWPTVLKSDHSLSPLDENMEEQTGVVHENKVYSI